MKNILKLGFVALSLLIAVPAFARNCAPCAKPCATRCETSCGAVCALPKPERTEVEYTTSCQGTPQYHWEIKKVYHPCTDKVSTRKACVVEQCVGVKEVGGKELPYNEGAMAPKKHSKKAYRKSF